MKKSLKYGGIFLFVSLVCIFSMSTISSASDWPKDLTVGTQGLGTASYAQTVAWSTVMEEKTGMKVRVRPTNSYAERSRAHKAGKIDLTNNTITEFVTIMEGIGNHATKEGGPYETGIVWMGQGVPFGFILLKDCEIKTLVDLKKKNWRVSLFTPSTASVNHVKGILAWAGVDESDVTFVPATSWSANTKSIVEGRADIAFSCPISTVAHEVEANPKGVRWIDFPETDKQGREKYMNKVRGIGFARNFKGVASSNGIYTASNVTYYHTNLSMDPDVIYQTAKWFSENYDLYKDKHKACKDMNLAKFREYLDQSRPYYYFPVHDGTVRYLKEIGKWSAADDAWNEKNKALMKKLLKAYQDAIVSAEEKDIKIAPKNKPWLDLWASYKKNLLLLGTKME